MDKFGEMGGIRCYRIGIPASYAPKWSKDDRSYVDAVMEKARFIQQLPVDTE